MKCLGEIYMIELVWYDQYGNRVEGEGKKHYLAPLWVSSGATQSGVPNDIYMKLKFEYPSLQNITNHSSNETHGAFIVSLPGIISHTNRQKMSYRIVIDARDFPHHKPRAFVFIPCDEEIQHCNIYHPKSFSVWPNKPLMEICEGAFDWESIPKDNLIRFATWLNQILQVLSNPNPEDTARPI
jgi:hypothetical protein